MLFKSILCVTGVNDDDAALKEAIELCQNTGTHLSVLVVGISPPTPVYAYGVVPDDGWISELESGRNRTASRGDAIEKIMQAAGISSDVEVSYCQSGEVDDIIGERSRYSDLTLVSSQVSDGDDLREKTIYGTLYHGSKPVLLSPKAPIKSFNFPKIMIAWDSGQACSRAVSLALGHLQPSDSINIVMVDPVASQAVNGAEPGADLARYLVRHNLNIEVDRLASGGKPIADILRRHATDINADLIIMGAYGHSRVRQLVFGGTTAGMLKTIEVPVLMAH